MNIGVIESIEELDFIQNDWNNLLETCAHRTPFLRFEYIKSWWKFLGGGEWNNGKLYIITILDDGNQLIGIAPLFLFQNSLGESVLQFIGTIEISDYLDFIATAENMEKVLSALFTHLNSLPISTWQTMILDNILDDSPTLKAYQSIATKMGWQTKEEILQPSPYIPLPSTYEQYLTQVDKKQRHEIRRKMRRFELLTEEKGWYIANERQTIEKEIDAFIDLMNMDKQKQKFLTSSMRAQIKDIALAAYENNWLQLAYLEVEGVKIAAYMNFDYNNCIYVYNSGLHPDYSSLSPGWVLLGFLIQHSIDNKRIIFDFMRGEEVYKLRFGSINRYVHRVSFFR